MGRLPALTGAPAFRFLPAEVAEMEVTALQVTGSIFPSSDTIDALAAKFSASPDRAGKVTVTPKQVLTWFHNRRYAPRSKELKAMRCAAPLRVRERVRFAVSLRRASFSSDAPAQAGASSGQGNKFMDNGKVVGEMMPQWTQVQSRSVPFRPSECVEVQCRDLVLCFQECEDISLHCEASVLAITRARHGPRECNCKFLVRFEHDKTEEIVTLEKLRRPPTNFHAPIMADAADCYVQPTAYVELTSKENSGRARQLVPFQYSLMNKKAHESTVVSNSVQEKPEKDGVGAVVPATSPETGNVPAPDQAISGSVKVAPEIIEIDD